MAIATSRLPRRHKELSRYSKSQLDQAESYLGKQKLLKTPSICWLFWAFYPIFFILTIVPAGKSALEQLDQLIKLGPYVSLIMAIIPLYIGIKIKENYLIRVTLDYFSENKCE